MPWNELYFLGPLLLTVPLDPSGSFSVPLELYWIPLHPVYPAICFWTPLVPLRCFWTHIFPLGPFYINKDPSGSLQTLGALWDPSGYIRVLQ